MASLVADAPEDHRLRMGYARLLLQLDRHEAAREQFRIVRERVPDDPDPLYALALLAIEAEQPDEAEPYFQRLLALGERENEAAYYLGSIAQTRERFPEAMTWYTRVAEGELRDEAALRIIQQCRDSLSKRHAVVDPDEAALMMLCGVAMECTRIL